MNARYLFLMLFAFPSLSPAEEPFPSRTLEMNVGFSAGGSVDLMARGMAEEMAKSLGQAVVVRNIEGASGAIAMKLLTSKPADGYAIAFGPETTLTSALHTSQPGYSLDSFEPVCQVFRNSINLSVSADSPYRSLQDLLAAMARKPGTWSYGHTGRGSLIHITVANLLAHYKVSAVDIPYRGEAGILPALYSGDISFGTISSVTASRQRTRLRVLATLDDNRDPYLPDVPSMSDAGAPSVPPVGLNGMYVRKGTPAFVVATLQSACKEATASQANLQRAKQFNTRMEYKSGEEFRSRIESDHKRIGELIVQLPLGIENGQKK